jgi:hypothetical protein
MIAKVWLLQRIPHGVPRPFPRGPILLLRTKDIQVEVEGKHVEIREKLRKRLNAFCFRRFSAAFGVVLEVSESRTGSAPAESVAGRSRSSVVFCRKS